MSADSLEEEQAWYGMRECTTSAKHELHASMAISKSITLWLLRLTAGDLELGGIWVGKPGL